MQPVDQGLIESLHTRHGEVGLGKGPNSFRVWSLEEEERRTVFGRRWRIAAVEVEGDIRREHSGMAGKAEVDMIAEVRSLGKGVEVGRIGQIVGSQRSWAVLLAGLRSYYQHEHLVREARHIRG